MATVLSRTHGYAHAAARRRSAALSFLGCGAVGAALVVALSRAIPLDWHFGVASAAVYLGIACVALTRVSGHHAGPRFGLPNQVTTLRAALTSLFGGLATMTQTVTADSAWLWVFALLGALALALDGVDGWLARRLGLASKFGARYDMEIDALLIALLSLLAWRLGKAGPWVLAIGGMRYGFIVAAAVLPWLRGQLPDSTRRKTICVVQGSVLCALLAPPLLGIWSQLLAGAALTMLALSFATDVCWLWRHARRGVSVSGHADLGASSHQGPQPR